MGAYARSSVACFLVYSGLVINTLQNYEFALLEWSDVGLRHIGLIVSLVEDFGLKSLGHSVVTAMSLD